MADPDSFKVIARLLREEASRPEVSREQSAKAKKLADYFETLVADPSIDRRVA